ncbi:MAG TPA: regulatory signaling modulator protein AmpE [Gammaproteobacteria bacterium]|jgi:AmpE protein|nr:regulatory signaling modulator protein AmpE [Gammaproteobacteria bacterium]
MSFVAMLLALLLDQGLRHLEPIRGPRWFHSYLESLPGLTRPVEFWRASAAVLVTVLVPTIVVLFLGHLLAHLWGLFGFLFAIAVLLFTLGPRDLSSEAHAYMDAVRASDESRALELARKLLGTEPPADSTARTEAVTRAVLAVANDRLFGVLLWFALLGPAGAVLYRCTQFLNVAVQASGASPQFKAATLRLYGILAWLPAHLAALGYALAGSFEDAVSDLRSYYHTCGAQFFQMNSDVLVCAGLGALRGVDEDAGIGRMRSALALVQRTLIIWLVIYGLITLFGLAW